MPNITSYGKPWWPGKHSLMICALSHGISVLRVGHIVCVQLLNLRENGDWDMWSSVSQKELPLPQELWERIPPDIQAALQVLIAGYEHRIATLEAELAALKTRVNQNSQTSSRPPSSDGPEVKRRPPPEPSS
jgi:Family of unknown function (DUF6444)